MKRNRIGTISLLALSLLSTTNGAYRSIPGAGRCALRFQRRNQTPACRYLQIKRADFDTNFVMVSNRRHRRHRALSVQRETPGHVNHKLIFHHRGNQYFLAEIWGGEGNAGMAMPATKAEQQVEVASDPATKNIEIALR